MSKQLSFGKPINIYDHGDIELHYGIFSIRILGGWDVYLGNFKVLLKNKSTKEIVTPKLPIFGIQSYEFGERAKKIMTIYINKPGMYNLSFENQYSLEVKHSMLFLTNLFRKPLPTSRIQILIS